MALHLKKQEADADHADDLRLLENLHAQLNLWYYACHGTLLWPCFRDYLMHYGLLSPSVPTLCLKDPHVRDDTIYPELLLTIGVVP